MKNVRLNLTENEKVAQQIVGLESNSINFNMNEGNVRDVISKEKAIKFNDELNLYTEDFESHTNSLQEIADKMGSDPLKLEIKPMQDHLLIKPFKHNPFLKMTVKNGIIVDTGGFKSNVDKNPLSGQYEEQELVILTACVIEIGPEVKYIQQGDVVFYHRRNAIPVPFFKLGLYNIGEYHILATVNENLEMRFNEIKENGKD